MKLINKSRLKKIQDLTDKYKWLLKLNDNELSRVQASEIHNALSELLRFANEVINLPDEVRQLNLSDFREVYDITEDTVTRFVYTKNFPAYKLGGRWYVDTKKYENEWRETEHANSYRFA